MDITDALAPKSDQLDAIDFPRAGWSLDVSAFLARKAAGGEQYYNLSLIHI